MSRSKVHDDSTVPPRRRAVSAIPERRSHARDDVPSSNPLPATEQPVAEPSETPLADLSKPTPLVPSLRQFGDYELIEEIARGGMGIVYKAWQRSLKRTVALKMILSGHVASTDDVDRFQAEAQAAASLSHPGIVPIFEVDQIEGQHFFAMEFIDGFSLARRVAIGPLEPMEAAMLIRRTADAVQYAHERGVIHRDLKPANIIVDHDGQPHVTDFGLAVIQEGHDSQAVAGEPIGTASYMPPEQAIGQRGKIGAASDVYSLGATLYCLITGRPPFQSANSADTLIQVIHHDPVPPRQLNQQIPKDIETICLKCLDKNPERRYASALELSDELRRYLRNEPILARPLPQWARLIKWCQRHRSLALVASVLMASVASLIAISVMYNLQLVAEREAARAAERQAERVLDLTQSLLSKLSHLSESETALLTLQVSEYAGLCATLEQFALMEDSPKADATRARLLDHAERLSVSAAPASRESLERLGDLLRDPQPTASKPFAKELRTFLSVSRQAWLENTLKFPQIRDQVQALLREETLQATERLLNRDRPLDFQEVVGRWSSLRHSFSIVADDSVSPLIDNVITQLTSRTDRRPPGLDESLERLRSALKSKADSTSRGHQ
ncbi:MAG: serine/threonine-protein kinase [Planctomycetaceae bacterium]